MKISSIITAVVLLLASTGAMATGNTTNECLPLMNNQRVTHDLNEPTFDNCYVVDNESNGKFVVGVLLLDQIEVDVQVLRYTPSTGEIVELHNQVNANELANYLNETSIGNDEYIIRFNNFSNTSRKKHVTVTTLHGEGSIVVSFVIAQYPGQDAPPPSGGGGFCDPRSGICFSPQSGGGEMLFSTQSEGEAQECTGELAPPADLPRNYPIEEFKLRAEAMNEYASQNLPLNLSLLYRGAFFSSLVASREVMDFKNPNSPYHDPNASAEDRERTGNYNYGYIGRAFGFDEVTLLKMSAFTHSGVPQGDLDLFDALRTGDWSALDGVNDQEDIEKGMNAYDNGCIPPTSSSSDTSGTGGGGGGGGQSGWEPLYKQFFGVATCLGDCDEESLPKTRVTITEWAPD